MPIDRDELDRRLAEADRARLALRRATLEWRALGVQLLASRRRPEAHEPARPERPDREIAARLRKLRELT